MFSKNAQKYEQALMALQEQNEKIYSVLFSDHNSISNSIVKINLRMEQWAKDHEDVTKIVKDHEARLNNLEDQVRDLANESKGRSSIKNYVITAVISFVVPVLILNASKALVPTSTPTEQNIISK
jgi:hypothetical protein